MEFCPGKKPGWGSREPSGDTAMSPKKPGEGPGWSREERTCHRSTVEDRTSRDDVAAAEGRKVCCEVPRLRSWALPVAGATWPISFCCAGPRCCPHCPGMAVETGRGGPHCRGWGEGLQPPNPKGRKPRTLQGSTVALRCENLPSMALS